MRKKRISNFQACAEDHVSVAMFPPLHLRSSWSWDFRGSRLPEGIVAYKEGKCSSADLRLPAAMVSGRGRAVETLRRKRWISTKSSRVIPLSRCSLSYRGAACPPPSRLPSTLSFSRCWRRTRSPDPPLTGLVNGRTLTAAWRGYFPTAKGLGTGGPHGSRAPGPPGGWGLQPFKRGNKLLSGTSSGSPIISAGLASRLKPRGRLPWGAEPLSRLGKKGWREGGSGQPVVRGCENGAGLCPGLAV